MMGSWLGRVGVPNCDRYKGGSAYVMKVVQNSRIAELPSNDSIVNNSIPKDLLSGICCG